MWWPAIGGARRRPRRPARAARARRRLRHDSRPARAATSSARSCSALLVVEGVDLGDRAGLGHLGRRARAAADHGRRARRRSRRSGFTSAMPALWAMISMAAMMGGTMRSPLTAIVFAARAHARRRVASGAARRLRRGARGHRAADEALDPHREGRPARLPRLREYSVSPLARFRVADVMERDVPTIPADMTVRRTLPRLATHDPVLAPHTPGRSWTRLALWWESSRAAISCFGGSPTMAIR